MYSSLLPASSSSRERSIDHLFAKRLGDIQPPIILGDGTLSDYGDPLVDLRVLWNIDRCPEHLLPWLGWTVSVDSWLNEWPEQVKRNVVRSSATVHPLKGTLFSIRDILHAQGVIVSVTEWWEKEGVLPPHTFELNLSVNENFRNERLKTKDIYQRIRKAIDETKPVRSQYIFFVSIQLGNRLAAHNHSHIQQLLRLHANVNSNVPEPLISTVSPVSLLSLNQVQTFDVMASSSNQPEPFAKRLAAAANLQIEQHHYLRATVNSNQPEPFQKTVQSPLALLNISQTQTFDITASSGSQLESLAKRLALASNLQIERYHYLRATVNSNQPEPFQKTIQSPLALLSISQTQTFDVTASSGSQIAVYNSQIAPKTLSMVQQINRLNIKPVQSP